MAFCIIPDLAQKLKQAAVEGKINIAELYDMDPKQRREVFKQYTDEATAREINAGFERAMISNQQNALKSWAEKTFNSKQKKSPVYKDVISKINDLTELGVLNQDQQKEFLSDLVASKLGATVTSDEAKVINEKSARLTELSKQQTEFGTPTMEYFKARREMDDYLDSITPSSKLKIISSIVARGNMLFSIKSPLVNIESNTVQGLLQYVERRVASGRFTGDNGDYAAKYTKFINQVFKETGYDLSRMTSLADSGRRSLGEDRVTTAGQGKTRRVGKFYEDTIFKYGMEAPDVAYAGYHFSDSANLQSAAIAAKEGLKGSKAKARALEIFKDATSLNPKTEEGQRVRDQARLDAQIATYTNDTVASKTALMIRKVFNTASGDARLGDQIMPFVKTPANVIQAGVDASGVLIPIKTAYRLAGLVKDLRSGEDLKPSFKRNLAPLTREFVRAGMGMAAAYAISSLFKPEDFIGNYPTTDKERQLLELKNATTNSIKIGNKWVSLDYFGPLGTPIVGFMYAKKYGKNPMQTAYVYYQGVFNQAAKIPGFTEFNNLVTNLQKDPKQSGKVDLGQTVEGAAVDFIRGRVIPAFINDLGNATDKYDRTATTPLQKIQKNIPGIVNKVLPIVPSREQLPINENIFGQPVKTEGFWSSLLAGSRLKSADNSPVVKELSRLDKEGYLPSITDVSKTSTKAKDLKSQIGETKFNAAMESFGRRFGSDVSKLIASSKYRNMSIVDKQKAIDKIKNDNFDAMLKKYHYKKPKPEKVTKK